MSWSCGDEEVPGEYYKDKSELLQRIKMDVYKQNKNELEPEIECTETVQCPKCKRCKTVEKKKKGEKGDWKIVRGLECYEANYKCYCDDYGGGSYGYDPIHTMETIKENTEMIFPELFDACIEYDDNKNVVDDDIDDSLLLAYFHFSDNEIIIIIIECYFRTLMINNFDYKNTRMNDVIGIIYKYASFDCHDKFTTENIKLQLFEICQCPSSGGGMKGPDRDGYSDYGDDIDGHGIAFEDIHARIYYHTKNNCQFDELFA